jgi:uncharacterized repeat protein (TIGR01451 family)
MGNGRGWGRSWGESSRGSLGSREARLDAAGALVMLLIAASMLLGLSSHRDSKRTEALAQAPVSPIPTVLQAPLYNSSSHNSSGLAASEHSRRDAKAVLGHLPLIFEPNQGQADPRVKFLARGAGYSLFLDETEAVLALKTAPRSGRGSGEQFVRMKLVGAEAAVVASGTGALPGKSNYFIGNDPRRWHSGVPQFAGVRYENVYPGIDLVFYGKQGHLEYDFRVAPGSNPSRAELQFDGADRVELKGGNLIVAGRNNNPVVRLQAPQIYQGEGDRRSAVEGRFVLRGANRVGFEIGAYDRSRELVIDPVLDFSTYFGGSGTETSPSVAVNGDGFIYLAGSTTSPVASFPLGPTVPTTLGSNSNIFVAKISPSQPPVIVYATFLGGNGADSSVGLGVDAGGNAYVAGNTTSSNFPTTSLAYETAPTAKGSQCTSTCSSIFVSVLNSLGSALTYSSYLSGNGNDVASGMAIDTQQDAFVTGTTTSNNAAGNGVAFPATQLPVPLQATPLSSVQFFATKVNTKLPGVSGVAYSTYFGGSVPANPIAVGGGIVVDTTGNMYFSGTTNFYNSASNNTGLYGASGSGDFPILNPYQPCLDTVPPSILSQAVSCSPPTTTPYPSDAFVAKINPTAQAGAQLLFSTYLGGTVSDTSTSVTIDSGAANVYLTGSTNSPDFLLPTGTQAFQECLDTPPPNVTPCTIASTATAPALFDAYVGRLTNPSVSTTGTPNLVTLTYFSYLGGSGNETGNAIAVDTASDALVTGMTNSTNFPVTTGAIQSVLNGAQNAFFAHIDTTTVTSNNQVGSYSTYFGGNGTDRGTSIVVDPNLNTYFAGDTTSTTLEVSDPLPGPGGTTLNGTSDAFVVKLGTAADLCITCTVPVVSPTGTVSAGNAVTITYTVANDGPDVATGIIVTGMVPTGVSFNSASAGSGTCTTQSGTTVACQIPTLQAGSTSTVTFTVTPASAGTYEATATVSSANDTNTVNTATASFVASGFSVTIAPAAQTVSAGQSAQYTVVVAPTQGVFGANVSLTCSALPSGASCNFTTATITLSGGAGSASTVLNLSTTAQPVSSARATWRGPLYAFWLMVPAMAFLGWGAGGKRRRGGLPGMLALMAFFALVLMLPACHSAKTQPTVAGTPSGTYPLTVTATSGSLTQSAPFSVTVTP